MHLEYLVNGAFRWYAVHLCSDHHAVDVPLINNPTVDRLQCARRLRHNSRCTSLYSCCRRRSSITAAVDRTVQQMCSYITSSPVTASKAAESVKWYKIAEAQAVAYGQT